MKNIIIFLLFPVLLNAQEIPKLQKQLDKANYEKCIKKSKRYAKWNKKNREVNYYFSAAYFGLINQHNSFTKNLSNLNKSLNYLVKFNKYNDKTLRTLKLENSLDSMSFLFTNNSMCIGISNGQIKQLNNSYRKLFNNNLSSYQQYIFEQKRISDSIDVLNFTTQTTDEVNLFGEYVPKRINRDELLVEAMNLKGVKYKWAGETPSGFDCSGYVMYVFKRMGIIIPHNAHKISCLGKEIDLSDAKTGDLLCFGTNKRIYHIGIYYKIDGKDGVIHCISGGVKADQDDQWNYWKPKIGKVRRIVL